MTEKQQKSKPGKVTEVPVHVSKGGLGSQRGRFIGFGMVHGLLYILKVHSSTEALRAKTKG